MVNESVAVVDGLHLRDKQSSSRGKKAVDLRRSLDQLREDMDE